MFTVFYLFWFFNLRIFGDKMKGSTDWIWIWEICIGFPMPKHDRSVPKTLREKKERDGMGWICSSQFACRLCQSGKRIQLLLADAFSEEMPDYDGKYVTFTTPYSGLVQVIPADLTYKAGQRFGLYRWHIMDPVRFKKDLRITIQDLGWRHGGRYLPQKSDISSTCFWYQKEPHAKFPQLPAWQYLEVN